MAIEINEMILPITPAEARNFLQQQTDNFGVFFDVERCYELVAILQLENRQIVRDLKRLSCNPMLNLDDKESVISTLVDMGVNQTEFFSNKTRKMSLNASIMEEIQRSPVYSEDVKAFLTKFATYTSNKRNKGNVLNYALLPQSNAVSKYNRRMSRGCPTWKLLSTSRIAASDPGIQGIPRTMGDIITEPKGYTLVRADSGQIEPRINFSTYLRDDLIINLIIYYDDAYFGLLHYCNMHEDEEAACRADFNNFKPMEITDEIKDMRQNIKHLTNAGSYGSSNLGNINPALAKVYEAKIVKHPARLALERKITQDVEHGIDTFYGMFGTPVTPDETEKYKKGDSSWKDHVIRCGINNPVQTTASELMMFSINEARKILSEAKDTHVCFYKHDEACFYVSDEDMANGIGDRLSEVTAYKVKGWIPINSDPMIGVKHGDYPSYIM